MSYRATLFWGAGSIALETGFDVVGEASVEGPAGLVALFIDWLPTQHEMDGRPMTWPRTTPRALASVLGTPEAICEWGIRDVEVQRAPRSELPKGAVS